ncbi:hypothetical protein [Bradyrhizobium sp. Ash2021]|uniref:ABC transporter ATP-binding protein C-terminal domain-containing protein n=1 Tax=Bradyrhizobium sp. Ash2021 TaxID=2954771 RepID=UPI002815FE73|nr:hypothetical protein [Bradyrhizobium sp. Ash2021]WMT76468.1 hypothetical protein NL528_08940 [Bradyrhizobium sp. Ash2021]
MEKKVIAIIGPGQTANTLAVGGLTNAVKLPHIALSGLGPAAELKRKCVFHIAPTQSLNARAMLDHARSLGIKRTGVLYFGEIIASGDMGEIQRNAKVREVYLGT